MDVKTAFLNGDLEEEVYMDKPEGFVLKGHEKKVCKLVKSLYGLKQVPKQWHEKFDEKVVSHVFRINESDKCVYSKFNKHGGVIICLYVDMLIFGTSMKLVDETKAFLSSCFDMKDMGEANVILGIKIIKSSDSISLTQSHYIEKLLTKYNHENCSAVSTPYDPSIKLTPNKGKIMSQLEYASVIGSLMYAMQCTRPNIAFAVGMLSRYTHNPGQIHWNAVSSKRNNKVCIKL